MVSEGWREGGREGVGEEGREGEKGFLVAWICAKS